MSSQSPCATGAEAPQESGDPALQDAVAGLICLSIDDRNNLNSYNIKTCEDKLRELISYVNDPTGKPQRTILDVLSQISLLYQRQAKLQAAEAQEQLAQLQNDNSHLRQGVQARVDAASDSQEEDLKLRSQLGRPHRAPQWPWSGINTVLKLPSQLGMTQLTNQQPRLGAEQLLISAAADLTIVDSYSAPHASHLVNPRFPVVESAPQSVFSRTTLRFNDTVTPFWGDEISPQAPRGTGNYGQAFTGDLQPSRASRPQCHRSTRDISSDDSDGPFPPRGLGLRTRQLESLARDVERFDPINKDTNVDDYLQEVECCLLDLPHPSSREKLKLLWKTTTRSVHVFMESLPPGTRDHYSALCQALRDEYSLFTDPASATLGAFAITQRKQESPKEYYRRLRVTYFQGRYAPGLEEEHCFKFLFLHNLHETVRYDVAVYCRTRHLPKQEIRRYAQMVWEIHVRLAKKPESDARVLGIQAAEDTDLALEGNEMPRAKTATQTGSQKCQAPNQQGGWQKHGGEKQGKQKQQNCSQPKQKADRNPKQGGKYDQKAQNHPNGGGMRSKMKELIRVCLAEAVR
ncbi:hypothetical protein ABVT39_002598 [Epinephelus coioides]